MHPLKALKAVLVCALLSVFLFVGFMGHVGQVYAQDVTGVTEPTLVYSPTPTSSKNSSLDILAKSSVFEEKSKDNVIEVFLFDKTPLSDILHMIAEMTGQNVVATPEIQSLPISLFLRNVTAFTALEVICKNYNLWFTEQNNIVSVMTIDEYGRELTLRRDEQTAVFNLKYASCITVAEAIANVFGTRVYVTSPEEVASFGHIGTDDYPSIGDEPDASVESDDTDNRVLSKSKSTGESFSADDRALMASTLRDNRYSPEAVLQKQIGGARALMTMFPRNNSIIIRAVDTNLIRDVRTLIADLDTPTRQLLLEVKVLKVSLSDSMESFFNLSAASSSGATTASILGASSSSTSTFSFGYLDNTISASLKMLESEGRVRVMNTPLMLVANNAAGKYFQGYTTSVRTGYTVTAGTTTDFSTTSSVVTPDYDEEDVGFTLEIAPSINEDRTVTMKIVAEISSIIDGPEFTYVYEGEARTGPTDTIETTELENIILGMDGQTLILGGLVEETLSDLEDKVPVLGDIPILNFFFKNTTKEASRTETVLLITPHIMMSPQEAQEVSNRVLAKNSQHPYQTQGVTQLFEIDEATDMVKSTLQGKAGETPFPFNIGRAIRKLVSGSRSGGSIVELGV
ncbi:MAG: hypothetical protein R3Y11_02670 [Pseudomonadota bacterium]